MKILTKPPSQRLHQLQQEIIYHPSLPPLAPPPPPSPNFRKKQKTSR